ncbi:hypothetical protein DY000_02054906 [Brassica cretica]|uniref:UBC core domain-containing protein n=1 Tax=Brassica cretica TaxID=69181 RepID=A0ABQ7ACV5_BRACR|nr:hypothetical protein DY000_02054906 [Brassica cretica]
MMIRAPAMTTPAPAMMIRAPAMTIRAPAMTIRAPAMTIRALPLARRKGKSKADNFREICQRSRDHHHIRSRVPNQTAFPSLSSHGETENQPKPDSRISLITRRSSPPRRCSLESDLFSPPSLPLPFTQTTRSVFHDSSLSFMLLLRCLDDKGRNFTDSNLLHRRMSTPARKRLMRDFKRLQQDPPAGISGAPQDNNIMLWNAVIFGPDDTPWDGGTFKLSLQFSEDYPNKPPTVRFVSRMFHPNIYADGSICLDILQNQWSPIYDVAAILTSIQSLLCDPNPNSPANSEAARMYSESKREYNRRVRDVVEQSWTADYSCFEKREECENWLARLQTRGEIEKQPSLALKSQVTSLLIWLIRVLFTTVREDDIYGSKEEVDEGFREVAARPTCGPDDSPWDGGTFKLSLQFSEDYPNKPPRVRFVSRMFHPNIYADGIICLDILQDQWTPVYNVVAILISIQSLLCDPNLNFSANSEAALMYSENKREYNRRVRDVVEQSWTADS